MYIHTYQYIHQYIRSLAKHWALFGHCAAIKRLFFAAKKSFFFAEKKRLFLAAKKRLFEHMWYFSKHI